MANENEMHCQDDSANEGNPITEPTDALNEAPATEETTEQSTAAAEGDVVEDTE